MARSVRDAKLESRTARLKLEREKRYWKGVAKGLHLGYRRASNGAGTWCLRRLDPTTGRYQLHAIGNADDHVDANGLSVFDFFQAQERARQLVYELDNRSAESTKAAYTVADAMRDYLDWYRQNKKAYTATRHVSDIHILPKLGAVEVARLTAEQIRNWHQGIARAYPRARSSKLRGRSNLRKAYDPRARRATANRILTVLRAALNHAWRDGKVPSRSAWEKVTPFRNVDAPRIRYLTVDECTRLINAAEPKIRSLITAALHTGCRYGELARMVSGDFDPDAGVVLIRDSKSGKPRHAYLTDEGRKFFVRQTAGRKADALVFTRASGKPWGPAHQQRPLLQACKDAAIEPAITFHTLRHTYGSALATRGVPLQVIAEALGHADTRVTGRHYAHLMPSYVSTTIRSNLPIFGLEDEKVRTLRPKRKRS